MKLHRPLFAAFLQCITKCVGVLDNSSLPESCTASEMVRIRSVLVISQINHELGLNPQWAYKIPFAIQWVWPVPLLIVLAFCPESPWWLVRKGRIAEAQLVIARLESNKTGRSPADVIAMMQRTIEIEDRHTKGASYAALFKGVDAKRTMSVRLSDRRVTKLK